MTKSRRARRRIQSVAESLGFALIQFRAYLRREPGQPRNTDWYCVTLSCPCGRDKLLHISHESMGGLPESLRQHLIRDGLI